MDFVLILLLSWEEERGGGGGEVQSKPTTKFPTHIYILIIYKIGYDREVNIQHWRSLIIFVSLLLQKQNTHNTRQGIQRKQTCFFPLIHFFVLIFLVFPSFHLVYVCVRLYIKIFYFYFFSPYPSSYLWFSLSHTHTLSARHSSFFLTQFLRFASPHTYPKGWPFTFNQFFFLLFQLQLPLANI